MDATPAESGAAGSVQQQPKVALSPPTAAASPRAAAAPAAPRLFKGVQQRGKKSLYAMVCYGKAKTRYGPFRTAEAAARAYDEKMREYGCLVVNFPQLPGEVQAVWCVKRQVTLEQHERDLVSKPARREHVAAAVTVPPPPPLALAVDTAAAVSLPLPLAAAPATALLPAPPLLLPPAEDARRYKGVTKNHTDRFFAFGATKKDPKECIGYFDTAKEAADAHDAHMRKKTPRGVAPVVNTPLHAGEIQAVKGEPDFVTRQRAACTAARKEAQPRRASRLPAPADALGLTPKKRKASEAAPEDADAGAGGYATDDDAAAAVHAEPEPERMPASKPPPMPMPPAPQQAPALAPTAPAPAAAANAATGNAGDDLVAFLRGILPALTDLDRVVVTAAGSGVQMSQLLDAVRAAPHDGASMLQLVADILGIRHGGDKLTLMKALQSLA